MEEIMEIYRTITRIRQFLGELECLVDSVMEGITMEDSDIIVHILTKKEESYIDNLMAKMEE